MVTKLGLENFLNQEALDIRKQRTQKAVVTEALEEYIQRRKQVRILELFGTIEYAADYEYKTQRKKL